MSSDATVVRDGLEYQDAAPAIEVGGLRRWVGSIAAGVALAALFDMSEAFVGKAESARAIARDLTGSFISVAVLMFTIVLFQRRSHSARVGLAFGAMAYLALQWSESSWWVSAVVAIVAVGMGRSLLPRTAIPNDQGAISGAELAAQDRRFQERAGFQFSTLLYRFPLGYFAAMAVPVAYFYSSGFESTRGSIVAALGVGVALGGALPVPSLLERSGRLRLIAVALFSVISVLVLDATLKEATSESFRMALPLANADARIAELALCFVLYFPFAVAGGWIGSLWRTFSPAEVAATKDEGLASVWFCVVMFGVLPNFRPRDAWIPVSEGVQSRSIEVTDDRIERDLDRLVVEIDGVARYAGSSPTIRNGVLEWLTPASHLAVGALFEILGPRVAWTDMKRGLRFWGELNTVDRFGSWAYSNEGWTSFGPLPGHRQPDWRPTLDHDICRVLLPATLSWEDLDHTWQRWQNTRADVAGVQIMRFLDLAAVPPNRVVKSLVPDAASVSVMLVFAGACGPFVVVTDADPKPELRDHGAWLPLLTQREFAAHDWPDEPRPYRRDWNPIASHATLDAVASVLKRDADDGERAAAAHLLQALAIHRDHDAGAGSIFDVPSRHVFSVEEADALLLAIAAAPSSHAVARQCRWLVELALETEGFAVMRPVLLALRRHHPDDLEIECTAARFFRRSGELAAALASWDRIVTMDPKDIDAAFGKARALFDIGAIDEARALAESVRPPLAKRTVSATENGSEKWGVRGISPHAGRFGLLLLHMARDDADKAEAFEYLRDGMEIEGFRDRELRAAFDRLRTEVEGAAK